MDIKFYIQALEQIKTQNAQVQLAICQVLGALKGEQFKQNRARTATEQMLQQDVVEAGLFTEKEICSMPKQFRKEFRTNGCVAHVRKKRNGPNSWSFEIRYRKNGYNISAVATTLEECKQKFVAKLAQAVGDAGEHAVENHQTAHHGKDGGIPIVDREGILLQPEIDDQLQNRNNEEFTAGAGQAEEQHFLIQGLDPLVILFGDGLGHR